MKRATSDVGSAAPAVAIRKSDTAEIRVTRSIWKMRQVVDVRLWYLPAGGTDYVPSRKGLTVDAAKIPELIEALQAA